MPEATDTAVRTEPLEGSPRSFASSVPPERQPVPARLFVLASAIGAALLVLIAFVAYRELLYYERRAIEHVPPGSELALRVDLEQVVLFEPVRRHLLPLLDRAPVGAGTESSLARLSRLRKAGLNLGLDLREVVFARAQGGAGWVLALGGIFGSQPLLPRIEQVLREEPGAIVRSAPGMLVFEASGAALGQADDGVLLLASDVVLLGRALPASRGYEAVGLGASGGAALGALGSWLGRLDATSAETSTASSSLRRVSARLEYGDPFELIADIEHAAPVDIEQVRREVDAWLGTPRDIVDFAPRADWGGERALAARAKLTQSTRTHVNLRTTWQRAEFDRAIGSLANWLEARLRDARPAAQ